MACLISALRRLARWYAAAVRRPLDLDDHIW